MRGTPQQIIDKYNQLARDAQLSNDRVAAENFQQHAEHYLRLLGQAQKEMEAERLAKEAEQNERRDQQERERLERQKRREEEDARSGRKPDDAGKDSNVVFVDGDGEQPDANAGLVTTPEGEQKPRRARSPRKPRKPKDESSNQKPADQNSDQSTDRGASEGSGDDAPAAAE
ncbi:DUF4167 domain-containing protein [Celeribacter arenosi]|uniref:DUF4167 domain-containing protein n=1 Tax=Celeribacter arenosi TaxID=792649 RepID=A0ABP7KEP0_9RHOB